MIDSTLFIIWYKTYSDRHYYAGAERVCTAIPIQYLPFRESYVCNHTPSPYTERFTFTGKDPRQWWRTPLNNITYSEQRDEETGYGYFGARYMDHELMTMWLSVDPLSDKYPSVTPYNYCMWNPMKLVDPDGREIDDYFDQYGNYLGSDNAKTDNIRVISSFAWNTLEKDENGKVDHDEAYFLSYSFSDASNSGMDTDYQKKVYDYYNTTGCATEFKEKSSGSGGLTSYFEPNKDPIVYIRAKANLTISLSGDPKDPDCNHAERLKSLYAHEKGHIMQYYELGHAKYQALSKYEQEKYAVERQMQDPSWENIPESFQNYFINYPERYKSTSAK